MPIAYSYRRFSSEKQAKGDSLRRQTELAERYIRDNPQLSLVLDTSLDLTDAGMSAYRGLHAKKGALAVFLRAVEAGRVHEGSYLLLESLDRLSRQQPLDALPQLLELVKNSIVVVTVADGKTYSNDTLKGTDGTFALMQALVVMARAHEESESKGQRVAGVWAAKRDAIASGKQLTSRVPFWIQAAEGGGERKLIPERAEVVRQIYEMAGQGKGNTIIAKTLNQTGVPAAEGERWHPSYIQKLLGTKLALGILTTGDGVEHAGYYPQLVSQEQYDRVKALEQTRGGLRATDSAPRPLAGLMWCVCGRRMKSESRSGRVRKDGTRNVWRYAVCSDAAIGKGCVFKSIPYGTLVATAYHLLTEVKDSAGWGGFTDSIKLQEVRSEIERATGQESAAYETYKALRTPRAQDEYFAIHARLTALKQEEAVLLSTATSPDTVAALLSKPRPDANDWWRALLRGIEVNSVKEEMQITLHGGAANKGAFTSE
jgi:DNA invertase Pin-like site-specific DNA recombinase